MKYFLFRKNIKKLKNFKKNEEKSQKNMKKTPTLNENSPGRRGSGNGPYPITP